MSSWTGFPARIPGARHRVLPGAVGPEDAEVRLVGRLPPRASGHQRLPAAAEPREVVERDRPRQDDPVVLHQPPGDENLRAARGRPERREVPVRVRLLHADPRVDLRPDRLPHLGVRHGAVGPPGDEERHAVPRYARRVGFAQEERKDFFGRAVAGDVRDRDRDPVSPADQPGEREGACRPGDPTPDVPIFRRGKLLGLRREEVRPGEEPGRERQGPSPVMEDDAGFLHGRGALIGAFLPRRAAPGGSGEAPGCSPRAASRRRGFPARGRRRRSRRPGSRGIGRRRRG